MKVQIKTVILIVVLLISIGSYLFFSTPLFYDKASLDPIKIYYSVSKGNVVNVSISIGGQQQSSIASKQRYPINYVKFSIGELFRGSMSEFKIGFENFTKEIDFWYDSGSGEYTFNHSKAKEYERNNVPDFLITASFIKNGFVPVWSQVWQSQPSMSVYTEPFLKETSFGVWEGEYFFDTKFSGTHLNGETYLAADVKKIIFEVNIPDNFRIENTNNIKLDKISGGYLLTKELEPGKTFHLVTKDSEKEKIKMVGSVISTLGIPGSILGILIPLWYDKRKKK